MKGAGIRKVGKKEENKTRSWSVQKLTNVSQSVFLHSSSVLQLLLSYGKSRMFG